MEGKTTTTQTTEKPAGNVVVPGKEVSTETTTKATHTETVPQVAEQQPNGETVAKDAPTEGGTRFR